MMKKLKSLLLKAHKKLLEILNFIEDDIIYLEGGLGSQILSTLEYVSTNKAIDISYFTNPPEATTDGPDIWPWELSRYGIELSFFRNRVRKKPHRWQFALRPQIYGGDLSTSSEYEIPWKIDGGIDLFPINEADALEVLTSYGIDDNEFGAIHIRRGDYLRVSSRVISIEENIGILTRLKSQLPRCMFVFSDTTLKKAEIEEIRASAPNIKMIFLSENELENGTVHDLMRMSKVLIAANSTFSYSAGLLARGDTTVYCPLIFFGGKGDYLKSRIFNQAGDYFLLR